MIEWSTNRNPAAARTAVPGTTRQSNATAPIGSRGAQFRAASMQRGAPIPRGAATKADDDPDKDEDDDKESLFGRGVDDDDDGLDDSNTNDTDPENPDDDEKPDEKKKVKI